jgi:3,4-dihydroxy-2-butanone 4-phosphate synthase
MRPMPTGPIRVFLKSGHHVLVHDIHEREEGAWRMRVSQYNKLRLLPSSVVQALERIDLIAVVRQGTRGMVCVAATRA